MPDSTTDSFLLAFERTLKTLDVPLIISGQDVKWACLECMLLCLDLVFCSCYWLLFPHQDFAVCFTVICHPKSHLWDLGGDINLEIKKNLWALFLLFDGCSPSFRCFPGYGSMYLKSWQEYNTAYMWSLSWRWRIALFLYPCLIVQFFWWVQGSPVSCSCGQRTCCS